MRFLEERIRRDGKVKPGKILKVDSFLNHQIDVELLDEIGAAFAEKYKDAGITRVLTIESSGIAIACMTAKHLHVPAVFAKKSKSLITGDDLYSTLVHSYTHNEDYHIMISTSYIGPEDTVLLVDDFLALGSAMKGLVEICERAGAKIGGIGIAIEKDFQDGGKVLRAKGYEVTSLAIIETMEENGTITFKEQ